MKPKLPLILYCLILLWLALGIFSMHVPAHTFWPAGFIAYTMPIPLLLNACFLLFWLFKRSRAALLPLLVLVLTFGYLKRGLALHPVKQNQEQAYTLEVLSFNARVFNMYRKWRDPDYASSIRMIDWVANHPADIILVQEYHNHPGSEIFDTKVKIGDLQGRESFISVAEKERKGAVSGMAIFSRFPIFRTGQIWFGKVGFNHAIFADIRVRTDTLRVYSVHLASMSIDDEAVAEAVKGKKVKSRFQDVFDRLQEGFQDRSGQVDTLLRHMQASPYPVLVGGDFNDIPWSYTYEQFSRHFSNAFQTSGTGLGSTFNGEIPFLRIDHQFYSAPLRAKQFTVHREMTDSDHFPISAQYAFPPKER
ncbi:endonuclease/exonuclease/phosphatase family protein [soil metagenome]